MQEFANSVLVLQPGLYILRHPGNGLAALTIGRAHSDLPAPGRIEVMSTPGTHGAVLRNGADCIVMQVLEAPAALLVSALLDGPGATVPQLRCDRIGLDAVQRPRASSTLPPMPRPPAPATPLPAAQPAFASEPITIGPNGISLIGHVEQIGDTVAAEGQELGRPGEQLRIEGLQIMWPDRPDGVDLAYSIGIEGIGRSPVVSSGNFCGTRGQARRITELTIALTGPGAAAFRLDGAATFSGGFSIPIAAGLPLGGPSGMEHLTGLSLRALPVPREQVQDLRNPWTESANTQIFKAPKSEVPAKVRRRQSLKARG